MDINEYNKLWDGLNSPQDIGRLAKEGYSKELLLVLYTEKHVRNIKRNYYHVAARGRRLLEEWKQGKSFGHLAEKNGFSPVLMASLVLREHGMTKREVREALKDYNIVRDMRIRKELEEAEAQDLVYSKRGYEIQRKRGIEGEAGIAEWLKKNNISYRTENDLKGEGKKTVDFLLDRPIMIDHEGERKKVCWIESKGSFGDLKKIRRDYNAQLKPYTEIWGPGIVVYWFGYLDGMDLWLRARDVIPVEKEWFSQPHKIYPVK